MSEPFSFYARAGFGKQVRPATGDFLAWLVQVGVPSKVVEAFRPGTLHAELEEFPFAFLSEAGLREINVPGGAGLSRGIDHGLLVIGLSLLNGDPIAIDLRDPPGAVGILNHETMGYVEDVRNEFWPVAFSLEKAADLLSECRFPGDYYEAQEMDEE
jgi:hypothetical protein